MIILDTNVLSELTRQSPDQNVMSWLDALDATDVGTTSVTAAELFYGVARLPAGDRKAQLTGAVTGLIEDDLEGRVAPFDLAAASHYAVVVSDREKAGRPIAVADAQIAAICRNLRATLATRNTKDFSGTGVDLVNPWLS
ncbi:MAG TPA: type II toxin-antitoxin system VapC family toxin [Streptosporangiaceae bacterium]|nr:type II toxin-antitoxin system VapC family toxin [Streptosporangiaceae bacterium]